MDTQVCSSRATQAKGDLLPFRALLLGETADAPVYQIPATRPVLCTILRRDVQTACSSCQAPSLPDPCHVNEGSRVIPCTTLDPSRRQPGLTLATQAKGCTSFCAPFLGGTSRHPAATAGPPVYLTRHINGGLPVVPCTTLGRNCGYPGLFDPCHANKGCPTSSCTILGRSCGHPGLSNLCHTNEEWPDIPCTT